MQPKLSLPPFGNGAGFTLLSAQAPTVAHSALRAGLAMRQFGLHPFHLSLLQMAALTESLAKEIKINDFKKKALTWRSLNGDLVYIINIQKSRFNDFEESFAINISIFSPEVYELCWNKVSPNAPTESDGIFRRRTGFFCKEKESNDWYLLKNAEEIPALLMRITGCLNKEVIPFLTKITSKRELYHYLKSLPPPKQDFLYLIQLACLAYLSGNKKNALEILEEVSSTNATWKENAEAVKDRILKTKLQSPPSFWKG